MNYFATLLCDGLDRCTSVVRGGPGETAVAVRTHATRALGWHFKQQTGQTICPSCWSQFGGFPDTEAFPINGKTWRDVR